MDIRYREVIAREFRNCVINTIRRLENTPTYRPFHAALLSDEALFWSRFERSFSTSFGQRVVEEISKEVALSGGATQSTRQKHTTVQLDKAVDEAISNHMYSIRSARTEDWNSVISAINSTPRVGETVERYVNSDLWWHKDGINHYMSIKTVKPNIDQTAVAKQDLLRLLSADPTCKVYFGLYYNPYGESRLSYAVFVK